MQAIGRLGLVALLSVWSLGVGSGATIAQSEPIYTIAFASFGPKNMDLFIAEADGSNAKPLLPHADDDYNASFSQNGEWIVGRGNYSFPSWASDGRRLVYRLSSSGGKTSNLIVLDTATGVAKVLATGCGRNNFPAWSPTEDLIAFTGYVDGDYEICTILPDGTDFKRLTNSPGNDSHCGWSFDGNWIGFTSARGGFTDEAALHVYNGQPYGKIYVMRANGSDVRQLTNGQFEHGTPSSHQR